MTPSFHFGSGQPSLKSGPATVGQKSSPVCGLSGSSGSGRPSPSVSFNTVNGAFPVRTLPSLKVTFIGIKRSLPACSAVVCKVILPVVASILAVPGATASAAAAASSYFTTCFFTSAELAVLPLASANSGSPDTADLPGETFVSW